MKDMGSTAPLIHPLVVPSAVFLLSASSDWSQKKSKAGSPAAATTHPEQVPTLQELAAARVLGYLH